MLGHFPSLASDFSDEGLKKSQTQKLKSFLKKKQNQTKDPLTDYYYAHTR